MTDKTSPGEIVRRKTGDLEDLVAPSPLRTLRGIAGTGLVWAGLWAVGGAIFRFGVSLLAGVPLIFFLPAVIGWAVSGFLAGAGFAAVLTTMERKTTLEDLSLVRVGAWGATGAFLASFLVMILMGVIGFVGVGWALFQGTVAGFLGAASAVGTTKLAKSAPDDRALLEPGE
jgi:hypothetical protein